MFDHRTKNIYTEQNHGLITRSNYKNYQECLKGNLRETLGIE